jgi:N-formylglutamate amidohydrolase
VHHLRNHHRAGLFVFVFVALTQPALWAEEIASTELLTLWAGMLPVIISAPHGGRKLLPSIAARHGHGIARFVTERDHHTDELAEMIAIKIHQKLAARPFLIVARFDRKYVDANRPRKDAYESESARPHYDAYHYAIAHACEQARRTWGRGLLLDIHGQGAEAEIIFRGTDNGNSVDALQRRFGREALMGPKIILGQMESRGYQVAPGSTSDQRERRYTGGYTVRTYGSHRGTSIDAIQLELGKSLRARANIERTASDLAHAIEIFARTYLPFSNGAEISKNQSPPS